MCKMRPINPRNVVSILSLAVAEKYSNIKEQGVEDKLFADTLLALIASKYDTDVTVTVCDTLDIHTDPDSEQDDSDDPMSDLMGDVAAASTSDAGPSSSEY